MMKFTNFTCILLCLHGLSQEVVAFTPNALQTKSTQVPRQAQAHVSREGFISSAIATSTGMASVIILPVKPAEARGRATLEYSYDRYYPRLEAGGIFYSTELKNAIGKNDWATIKVRFSNSCLV